GTHTCRRELHGGQLEFASSAQVRFIVGEATFVCLGFGLRENIELRNNAHNSVGWSGELRNGAHQSVGWPATSVSFQSGQTLSKSILTAPARDFTEGFFCIAPARDFFRAPARLYTEAVHYFLIGEHIIVGTVVSDLFNRGTL